MSHFTVLAILGTDIAPTDDAAVHTAVGDLLEAYSENMEVPGYRVYEHENILKCACYHAPFAEKFGPPPHFEETWRDLPTDERKAKFDELDEAQVAYGKRIWNELGGIEFAKQLSEDGEEYGYDVERSELYRISTYNPDSKWDWYVIGGRWRGMFQPKPGAEGATGEPGAFGNEATPGGVDVIRVGDIDWEAMAREVIDERQAALAKFDETGEKWNLPWGTDTESPTWREDYLNSPVNVGTYAIVDDEGWHGRGEMGWFGMGTEDPDVTEWAKAFMAKIESLDPKTTVAAIDCHI